MKTVDRAIESLAFIALATLIASPIWITAIGFYIGV